MLQNNLLQHFWAALNMHKSTKKFGDFLQLQNSCERILPQIHVFLQKNTKKGVGTYASMGAYLVSMGMWKI